ncbi:MAG: serine/threonine-protein kinase [Polyangiaceae bacterium]
MGGGEFMEGGRYRSYRLLKRLGEGGMGAVWLAEHVHTEHRIAIKLMVPPSLQGTDLDAGRYLARFKREATIMTRFNHPNVPAIYDMDVGDDGRGVIQMEYLDGRDFRYVLDSLRGSGKPCSVIDALYIGVEVAKPMQIAHGMGIVHRDLKPENIFLCRGKQPEGKGQVRVLDFGIAHYNSAHRITRQSNVLGTVLYTPPEVLLCHDDETDGRADIYALGVVLWEALAGRHPHVDDRARIPDNQVLGRRVIEDEVPALNEVRADVPADLARFVGRMLAKEPGQRVPDMESVQRELSRLLVELQRQVGGQTMFTRAGVTLLERAAVTPLLASNGFVSPERTTPMPRSARAPGAPLSSELERLAALPASPERTRGIEHVLMTHDDAAMRARAVQLLAEVGDDAVLPTLAFAALWERERSQAVLEAIDAALSARIPALHPTRSSPQALALDPTLAPAPVHRVLDVLYWLEGSAVPELGSMLERTLDVHPFATIRYAAADALRRDPRLQTGTRSWRRRSCSSRRRRCRGDRAGQRRAPGLGCAERTRHGRPGYGRKQRAAAGDEQRAAGHDEQRAVGATSSAPSAATSSAPSPRRAARHRPQRAARHRPRRRARHPRRCAARTTLMLHGAVRCASRRRAPGAARRDRHGQPVGGGARHGGARLRRRGDHDARLALISAALCELEVSLPLRAVVDAGLSSLAHELGGAAPGGQERMARLTRLSHLANALERGYDGRGEQLFVLDAFGVSMVNHPFVELRSLAAQALARIGDTRCLPMLERARAAETDRHVRRYVEEARAAIVGRAERSLHAGAAVQGMDGRRVWMAIALGMVVAVLGVLGWMLMRGQRPAEIPGGPAQRKASAARSAPEVDLRRGPCPAGEGRGDA